MATKNLGTVRALQISSSPPTNTYLVWYNTGVNAYTQYKHFYYDVNTSTWTEFVVDTTTIFDIINSNTWKKSVVAATTVNITIATALNAGDTLDGVVLVTGDRVLVKNQTTASQNGIYEVGTTPVRVDDMDESEEFNGAIVPVLEGGTQNGGTTWKCTNVNPTVGSTSITFKPYATFESIDQATLTDNLTTNIVIGNKNIHDLIQFRFLLQRNSQVASGFIEIYNTGTIGTSKILESLGRVIFTDDYDEIEEDNVSFDIDYSGNNLRLIVTLDSTGNNGTLNIFDIKRLIV